MQIRWDKICEHICLLKGSTPDEWCLRKGLLELYIHAYMRRLDLYFCWSRKRGWNSESSAPLHCFSILSTYRIVNSPNKFAALRLGQRRAKVEGKTSGVKWFMKTWSRSIIGTHLISWTEPVWPPRDVVQSYISYKTCWSF